MKLGLQSSNGEARRLIKQGGVYLNDDRVEAIDAAGAAQPMPRPFPKSGNVTIQKVPLTVEA